MAARGRRRRTLPRSRSVAVRRPRLRGPRGQRSHPLAALDQRDRHRRLALRLRRWTRHPARRSQARDTRRCPSTAPSAARPAGRARAARARRADGSRGARARAFLSGAGETHLTLLLGVTGGHPYATQELAYALWETRPEGFTASSSDLDE